jgi:Fic family protein
MFNPKYQITSATLNNLTKIAEIRALVSRARLFPARESFLRQTAIIKMAHTSTSIEGNTLNEYQVGKILRGEKLGAEEDQLREIKNYLKALRLVDKIAAQKSSFNKQDILGLHRTVISGLVSFQKAGVFRPGPVYVVNVLPDGKEKLVYTPPKAKEVPGLIEELLLWLKTADEEHPIIRAGLFHYQFETIHPFADGNGRVGRLLTLLHLYQSGWDFRHSLVLEDYYNRDRKRYYLSLQTGKTYQARKQADLTGWLEYFVTGFLDEAEKVKEQVLALEVAGKSAAPVRTLNQDELKIIDFVITLGQITSADVVDILRIPKRTAQAKLKRLEEARILVKKGRGPATAYFLRSSV